MKCQEHHNVILKEYLGLISPILPLELIQYLATIGSRFSKYSRHLSYGSLTA